MFVNSSGRHVPDILTDWIEPSTAAVVLTRFWVAAVQSFLFDPMRLDTQPCAWVDTTVRMMGTIHTAPTCRDKRPIPTATSISLAQDSLSSPRTLMMISTSIRYMSDESHMGYTERDQPLVINDNAAPSLLAPSEMIRIRL
jgi:hypothetical protein